MVKPGMRHLGHSETASFSQRMRRFWHLSSAPTLILLAKAKYLRVLTCAIISVQVKGVEKVIIVFFSLKEFVI